MSIELANTILVVGVFIAMLVCQIMCIRNKEKNNYKNSLFWDINMMLLAINQEWIILDVAWYTTVQKGVLIGINGLGFICTVFSVVGTIEYRLREVPAIEPCESTEDIIRREG